MPIQAQILAHIASQPEPTRSDMQALHALMLRLLPQGQLWFDPGLNEAQKVVANPTIGYGRFTIRYATGKTKDFFQVGVSANATGLSVYILGLKDKTYLPRTYGGSLGKASVTGYCIRFKALKDIDLAVLEAAIRFGLEDSVRE